MRNTMTLVAAAAALFSCAYPEGFDEDAETNEGLENALVDFGDGPVSITYEVINGMAVYQDDMVLGPAEALRGGVLRFGTAQSDAPQFFGLISTANGPWPNAKIPYTIASNVTEDMRDTIDLSIRVWNKASLIQWVPRTGSEHAVTFSMPSDIEEGLCRATLGRQVGNSQSIELHAWCRSGTILHEMGHAAGLQHEHNRWDRDQHVIVDLSDVPSKYHHAFEKVSQYSLSSRTHREYDPRSIMHYSGNEFADDSLIRTTCDPSEEHDMLRWKYCGMGSSSMQPSDRAALTDMVIRGQAATHMRPVVNNGTNLCLAPVKLDVGEPTAVVDKVMQHPVFGTYTSDVYEYTPAQIAEMRRGGVSVQVIQCKDNAEQQWVQRRNPQTDRYQIINKHYGECLEYYADSRSNDEHLRMKPCNNTPSQSFSNVGSSNSPLRTAAASNRCIDASHTGPLRFVGCSSAGSQDWKAAAYSIFEDPIDWSDFDFDLDGFGWF